MAMSLRRGHCDLSLEAGNADVLRKSHHEHVLDLDPSSTDQWRYDHDKGMSMYV